MPAEERRPMGNEDLLLLKQLVSGIDQLREDIKALVRPVERYGVRIEALEKRADSTETLIEGNGRDGLRQDLRELKNSFDMFLKTQVVSQKQIDPRWITKWVAIGAGVIAYIVEVIIPLLR